MIVTILIVEKNMRYARLIFLLDQMKQHKDLLKLPYNATIKEIFR